MLERVILIYSKERGVGVFISHFLQVEVVADIVACLTKYFRIKSVSHANVINGLEKGKHNIQVCSSCTLTLNITLTSIIYSYSFEFQPSLNFQLVQNGTNDLLVKGRADGVTLCFCILTAVTCWFWKLFCDDNQHTDGFGTILNTKCSDLTEALYPHSLRSTLVFLTGHRLTRLRIFTNKRVGTGGSGRRWACIYHPFVFFTKAFESFPIRLVIIHFPSRLKRLPPGYQTSYRLSFMGYLLLWPLYGSQAFMLFSLLALFLLQLCSEIRTPQTPAPSKAAFLFEIRNRFVKMRHVTSSWTLSFPAFWDYLLRCSCSSAEARSRQSRAGGLTASWSLSVLSRLGTEAVLRLVLLLLVKSCDE